MAIKKSPPTPTDPAPKPRNPVDVPRKSQGNPGKPKHRWSNVLKARELFESRAKDYVKVHFETVKKASESGKEDVALRGAAWALEHMSAPGPDNQPIRVISESIDAEKQPEGGQRAPSVMISFPFAARMVPGHPATLEMAAAERKALAAAQPAIEGELANGRLQEEDVPLPFPEEDGCK